MINSHEEFAKKIQPGPPPLPGQLTISVNSPRNKSSCMRRNCCVPSPVRESWDLLFDEAYRADVRIHTDDGTIIYGHASILGFASPVFRSMFKDSKCKHRVNIRGVPPEAVRIFIRFLYSSCYEEPEMEQHVLSLLVLSHSFAVPELKRECEYQLEHRLLNIDNVVDVYQLSQLCDAPRLSIICLRFILANFKAVSTSAGWKVMRESHPQLQKELIRSLKNEDRRRKQRVRNQNEKKIYQELYEAMEALVHICRDGCGKIRPHDKASKEDRDDCGTIRPHDKVSKEDHEPCRYAACKRLESLVRHFSGCKSRVSGGCSHCKRLVQLLELHSRICADSNVCKVPLCKNFKHKIAKESKKKRKRKEEMKWKLLVRKILRTKSITGAPYFTLAP